MISRVCTIRCVVSFLCSVSILILGVVDLDFFRLFCMLFWLFRGMDARICALQAKNAVLNISEMEAKVREATNDEPWYTFLLSSS